MYNERGGEEREKGGVIGFGFSFRIFLISRNWSEPEFSKASVSYRYSPSGGKLY
jgi:hypothetical protein